MGHIRTKLKNLPLEYRDAVPDLTDPELEVDIVIEPAALFDDLPEELRQWQIAAINKGLRDVEAGNVVAHDRVLAWAMALGTDDEHSLPLSDATN